MSASDQPLSPQVDMRIESPRGTDIGLLQPQDHENDSVTSTHAMRLRQMSETSIPDARNLVENAPVIDATGSDADVHQDEYEPTLDDDIHSPSIFDRCQKYVLCG